MEKLSEIQRELLSAYFDGALEGAELQEAQELLRSDAQALRWLDQLSILRGNLQLFGAATQDRVPATLAPVVRKARSGLATRVLQQAQLAARQQGLSNDHHVLSGSPRATVAVATATGAADTEQTAPSYRGSWLVLAAVAAALCALAVLPGRHVPRQALLDSTVKLAPSPAPEPLEEPAPSDLASNISPPSGNAVDSPVGDSPVGDSPAGSKVVARGNQSPDQMHQPVAPMGIELLTVCDVQMTASGWDAARFDRLLVDLGINAAADIVAEPQFVQALLDDQMLVADNQAQPNDSEVVLMYIKCPAAAVERLLVTIESERDSFSGFRYNMIMGGMGESSKVLEGLRSQISPTANEPANGYSRMIVLADGQARQLVSAFRAVKLSGSDSSVGPALLNSRAAAGSLFAPVGDKQPAELLIILRKE